LKKSKKRKTGKFLKYNLGHKPGHRKVKRKGGQMATVLIPTLSYHNIIGPLSKAIDKKFEVLTILEQHFVELEDRNWLEEIKSKLGSMPLDSRNSVLVLTGHPLVSLVSALCLLEKVEKLTVYAWYSRKRKYVGITISKKEGGGFVIE